MSPSKHSSRCAGFCQRSAEELQKLGLRYIPLQFTGHLLKETLASILEQHKAEISGSLAVKLREILKIEGDVLCELCAKNIYEVFAKRRRSQLQIKNVKDPQGLPADHHDRLREETLDGDDALEALLRDMGLDGGDTAGGVAR